MKILSFVLFFQMAFASTVWAQERIPARSVDGKEYLWSAIGVLELGKPNNNVRAFNSDSIRLGIGLFRPATSFKGVSSGPFVSVNGVFNVYRAETIDDKLNALSASIDLKTENNKFGAFKTETEKAIANLNDLVVNKINEIDTRVVNQDIIERTKEAVLNELSGRMAEELQTKVKPECLK